ncbi:MAG: methyltransferase domain-containing protein [Alteromonadaceae bacterium]|nr:methyltransferase domain-containing protein [Alteromonadaceae bacterium]
MSTGFYRSFEDLHRGSEEAIAKRLEVYQPVIQKLHDVFPSANALDLGCGRGEWLTTLQKTGFQAAGVDTDPDMHATCQSKSLNSYQQDALDFLQTAPDNHYALVSAFHFIEHIPFESLNKLTEQLFRVLKPGGVVLLETPNPENPVIGSCYFYMDPTHVKPLPPALLKFLAEYIGFSSATVWRLNEERGLRKQAPSLETVLKGTSPDYAVVGQKPGNEQAQAELAPLIEKDTGITLDELTNRYDNHHRETAEHLENKIHDEAEQLSLVAEKLEKLEKEKLALAAELEHVRQLQQVHDEKIRSLAVFTRILQPLYRAGVRGHSRYLQIREASRTKVFYQWQLIKLLKLVGLNDLAAQKAKEAGLTLSGQPLNQHLDIFDQANHDAPTGPLAEIQHALVRDLAFANNTYQSKSDNKLRICIEGHFSGSYSLAGVNRALAMAFLKSGQAELTVVPRESERTAHIHTAPAHELAALRPLINTESATGEVALYHHFPIVENPDPAQGKPVLLFFWEETLIPQQTIQQINSGYAGVLAATWFVKKALIDSGCRIPVALVPMPLEDKLSTPPEPGKEPPYRFLHVSSCFPRKGADVLFKAFNQLLRKQLDAELVVKTFANPHNTTEQQLQAFVDEDLHPRVHLIIDDYSAEQMDELYRSAHAVVLPTRGEGLNLPAAEAIRYNLPLIITGYGAHTDFLTGDGVKFVNYRFAPSQSHVHAPGALWVNPDINDLERQCTAVLEQLRSGNVRMHDTRTLVTNTFYSDDARHKLIGSLRRLAHADPVSETCPPVTIMTTWGEACGIAEYSRYLAQELMQLNTPVSVWAPKHLAAPSQAPLAGQLEKLDPCWQPQTGDLPLHSLAESPDTIWIQHHPGFFSLDHRLEKSIATATKTGYLRFITLHATLPLLQLLQQQKEQAAKTLNQFYRVIVHKPVDVNILKELGVTDNVTMLPQGIAQLPVSPHAKEAQDKPFTVGCFGFLFPHKGIAELVEAFSDFVKSNPSASDARLMLLNSIHPTSSASADYKEQCEQRIRELGLEQQTELHSDFLDEQTIADKLAHCDLLVLPYRETPESSSGAVRTALACCETVAVTPAQIFDEVRDATLAIPGFNKAAITQTIQSTWAGENAEQLADLHKARDAWIKQHEWPEAARKHQQLVQAAHTDTQWLAQGTTTGS